ncbi:MAG: hypothetical protein Q9M91_06290 [Candidatus Dojkabacteria bacterium]|nr:hypothetical protein [Candidatus Dojkabacteria bacterium]
MAELPDKESKTFDEAVETAITEADNDQISQIELILEESEAKARKGHKIAIVLNMPEEPSSICRVNTAILVEFMK